MCFVVLGFGLVGLPGAKDFKIHCRLFGPTSATRFRSEKEVADWLGALPHTNTAELFCSRIIRLELKPEGGEEGKPDFLYKVRQALQRHRPPCMSTSCLPQS
jgi:hypothetical protein